MPKFEEMENKLEWKKDEARYGGSTLVKMKEKGKCWHCGVETYFADLNFMLAPLCSTECFYAKWEEFEEAYGTE